jgi:DnaD/phage-associated family protein
MARPNKQGVDYFPLDVHLDDKFKFIEIKYKLEGFAILIKLMQKIYSYGYWYKWTDDEALLFSDEIRADYNLVVNVVSESLDRGVFNKELHDKYNILTSKGIQKRYKEIVRRRKEVEVIDEYLLIDNNFGVNDVINQSQGQQPDDKSTQSKVKESKGKETTTSGGVNPFDFYQQNFGMINSFMSQQIGEWIDDVGNELVVEAMKIALKQQKKWSYAEGILKRWVNENITSVEQLQHEQKEEKSTIPNIEEKLKQRAARLVEMRKDFLSKNDMDGVAEVDQQLKGLEKYVAL